MVERRAITVQGVVQGVGFRPFVHGLAARLGLAGFVNNSAGAVRIEVEGDAPALAGKRSIRFKAVLKKLVEA